MGLFSSKHIFTAYAGSSSLIEEDSRKSTVQGLMLQSMSSEVGSIADAIKLGLNINLYARARSMLRYALRDGGYVYGTPEPTHQYRDYLPIIPLMQDRVWFDETDQPELEKTTHRILKKLALDSYEIKEDYITTVEEGIASGERPGTDQLDDWDFFIHFAVPMHTRNRGSREYIMEYLKWIGEFHTWNYRADYVAFLDGGQVGDQPSSNFHISEGEGSNTNWEQPATGYEVFYEYSYIETVNREGRYTPPGRDEPLRNNRCYSKIYRLTDGDYAEGLEEIHGEGATLAGSEPEGTYHTYAVFTQQYHDIDTDEWTYTQVLVMAPSMMYVINVTDEDGVTEFQYVDVPLFPEDPEEDSEFRWPVLVEALKEVSPMHREECLQEALCATVFLVEHVKVKWYQKTFFRWLIVIVVIIIIIIFQQYHLLAAVKGLAIAAFALGATATALAYIALYVALTFVLGFLIAFAGSLIGGRAGMLFVIAATLYMAGVNPFANMSSSWTGLVAAPGFGTALSFLQAVMPIIRVADIGYSAYQMDKLQGEMEDFLVTKREKYDELADAWDMIGAPPAGIDPIYLTSVFPKVFQETPDSFYSRTLNANPGILGYDLINNFSAIALQLPEDGNDINVVESVFNSFARQRGAA